ncbi:MAG: Septum formation initiator family protein [Candidatus Woesebacteria bacterium GW2011_GWC1_38_13]|nr:MAG: Septum formation initiator family protein [Candidatus Woesebacteria bacterium GW2011_GWC1_38_13]
MRHNYRFNQGGKKGVSKAQNRIVTLLLIIFFMLFISSLSQTSKKIQKVNLEVAFREEELKKLKEEQDELKIKLEEITSQEYIERQLRNELGLTKENEIVLVLPPDEILIKLLPVVEEEVVEIKPNWQKWATLFGLYE